MEFCQPHWNALRQAINKRGLSTLVSEGGEQAALKVRRQVEEGVTLDTYDPLMGAHNAILANVGDIISKAGGSPLYLFSSGPEDPMTGYGPKYEGRTWPRCPLCYLGLAHEVNCKDRRCVLPKVNGYDWMIDRAADDQVEIWKELQP